jgi:homoserine dehydrogenase
MKNLKIGLFGFGVVGEGIYKVLEAKPNLNCQIKKICIKDIEKKRDAPDELFTDDPSLILNDAEINVVVELIDDATAAFKLVKKALQSGKSVVSANKKMIAENHAELIKLQKNNDVSLLYEAAVCGSIPIIRNLEEYFDNDLLKQVSGIVNGSTNYILTKMASGTKDYTEALQEAQESGFAESDPTLDVNGTDAAHKLSIIALHAFGKFVDHNQILSKGITALSAHDFQFAKEKGLKIKLLASATTNINGANEQHLSVFPTFVKAESTLSQVDNEYNGVLVGSSLADEQFLYGKGAGRYPTASAVLSDISALRYDYKYEFRKGTNQKVNTDNSASSTYYISFDRDEKIDLFIFTKVHEQYSNGKRAYVIGDISNQNLQKIDFWKKDCISIIAFDK